MVGKNCYLLTLTDCCAAGLVKSGGWEGMQTKPWFYVLYQLVGGNVIYKMQHRSLST